MATIATKTYTQKMILAKGAVYADPFVEAAMTIELGRPSVAFSFVGESAAPPSALVADLGSSRPEVEDFSEVPTVGRPAAAFRLFV